MLRALRRDFGTTLFLTTHYMDEAENCDRIAVIDHGKIVALDTPAALKQRVGKDLVTARSAEPAALARLLSEKYGITSTPVEGGLSFLVEEGDAFIVKLLTSDRPVLGGISVRRPTLDDVFLSLTGGRSARRAPRVSSPACGRSHGGAARCWEAGSTRSGGAT